MSTFSISLGKLFGIPTRIHWTFWILIAWIIYINASEGQGGAGTLWYILFVFAIFACVVFHELGHALAARRYDIQTRSITILPIGGVAALEKIPENPRQELVVALAGPLVNVLIAAGLWGILSLMGGWDLVAEDVEQMAYINSGNFLQTLLLVNIMLVVFNLIPAFPMDGGRVLRALLAMRMPRVKATEWAVNLAKVFAILFVFWGFSANPFLVFIALFIFLSANAELEHVRSESYLGGHLLSDILMTGYTLLNQASPLSEAVQVLLNSQEKQFLITDGKNVTGYLGVSDIIQGLTNFGPEVPLAQVANAQVKWEAPEKPINEVRMRMLQEGIPILAVGAPGRLLGIVDLDNINEFLLIQSTLQGRRS